MTANALRRPQPSIMILRFRCTEKEAIIIRRAAKRAKLSLSDYLRDAAIVGYTPGARKA